MTAYSLHSSSVRAGAGFKVPILSWTAEVNSRFFQAIYSALNEVLYIQPSDFVATAGVSLGECSAALRIFGGNSTLTLKANGVIAEFPNITQDRVEFVNSVIFQGYEALRKEFIELEVVSIFSSAGFHLEFTSDGKAQKILTAGSQTEIQNRAHNLRDAVIEPGTRFRLVSKDGKWNCKATVEKSEAVNNGVFLHREIIISDLSGYETTQHQFDLVDRIDLMILELIGLKSETQ